MYVATNRINVRKPHGPDLEELFKERGGLEQVPGFLRFELWQAKVEAEHEEFLVVSHWESAETHDLWTQSEAFRRAHSGMRSDFIMGPGGSSAYEFGWRFKPKVSQPPIPAIIPAFNLLVNLRREGRRIGYETRR